jgi:hypothetical protein
MSRFVKTDTDVYVNLDDVRIVQVSGSNVNMAFRSTTSSINISCADSTEASEVAAKIARAYDPKA